MSTAEAPIRVRQEGDSASSGTFYVGMPVLRDSYRVQLLYVPDGGTDEAPRDVVTGIRFADLAEWWHEDRDAKSTDRQKYDHPAYRKILAMGDAVIPYILADMRDRGGHWFSALRQLSGDPTVDANANGSMKRAREAWLAWGKARGRI